MATFNPRIFSNPDRLKHIAPARLLAFLAPWKAYFAARVDLSAADPDDMPLDDIAHALMNPDATVPEDMVNALYYVDETASHDSMEQLLDRAAAAGIDIDDDTETSAADVAVQIWLAQPMLLQRHHAEGVAFARSNFMYFAGSGGADAELPDMLEAQRVLMQNRMDGWFEKKRRGRGCRIFAFPRGSKIWFLVRHGLPMRREGKHLRLEVWDRGPGIPLDKQKVIFEEFKRLDSHQTRAEKGLGLGLAIADGLCRVLEHPLQVRSWPQRGSVFSVSVPLASHFEQAVIVQEEPATTLVQALRVLCIDNEDSILVGMDSLLSRWGMQVWTARNQLECEHLLDEGVTPQLVLVDYHLDEGETGTALMAWLRQRLGEQLPGVVISADARSELIDEVHAANLDYLPKPIKPAALRALLNRHLAN